MTYSLRAKRLSVHLDRLASHWTTISAHATADGKPGVVNDVAAALEDLATSTGYSITTGSCKAVDAAARAAPDNRLDLTKLPAPRAVAVFDYTIGLDAVACPLKGLQWSLRGDKLWLVPLTTADTFRLQPGNSPCPMMTGYFIGADTNIDALNDAAQVTQIAIALWQYMGGAQRLNIFPETYREGHAIYRLMPR